MSKYTGYKYSASGEAWKKENTTRVTVRFHNRIDADILDRLSEQENKAGYLKALIRADIEKQRT